MHVDVVFTFIVCMLQLLLNDAAENQVVSIGLMVQS